MSRGTSRVLCDDTRRGRAIGAADWRCAVPVAMRACRPSSCVLVVRDRPILNALAVVPTYADWPRPCSAARRVTSTSAHVYMFGARGAIFGAAFARWRRAGGRKAEEEEILPRRVEVAAACASQAARGLVALAAPSCGIVYVSAARHSALTMSVRFSTHTSLHPCRQIEIDILRHNTTSPARASTAFSHAAHVSTTSAGASSSKCRRRRRGVACSGGGSRNGIREC